MSGSRWCIFLTHGLIPLGHLCLDDLIPKPLQIPIACEGDDKEHNKTPPCYILVGNRFGYLLMLMQHLCQQPITIFQLQQDSRTLDAFSPARRTLLLGLPLQTAIEPQYSPTAAAIRNILFVFLLTKLS